MGRVWKHRVQGSRLYSSQGFGKLGFRRLGPGWGPQSPGLRLDRCERSWNATATRFCKECVDWVDRQSERSEGLALRALAGLLGSKRTGLRAHDQSPYVLSSTLHIRNSKR